MAYNRKVFDKNAYLRSLYIVSQGGYHFIKKAPEVDERSFGDVIKNLEYIINHPKKRMSLGTMATLTHGITILHKKLVNNLLKDVKKVAHQSETLNTSREVESYEEEIYPSSSNQNMSYTDELDSDSTGQNISYANVLGSDDFHQNESHVDKLEDVSQNIDADTLKVLAAIDELLEIYEH